MTRAKTISKYADNLRKIGRYTYNAKYDLLMISTGETPPSILSIPAEDEGDMLFQFASHGDKRPIDSMLINPEKTMPLVAVCIRNYKCNTNYHLVEQYDLLPIIRPPLDGEEPEDVELFDRLNREALREGVVDPDTFGEGQVDPDEFGEREDS